MENAILHRQTNFPGIGADIVQVLLVDLFSPFFEHYHSAVIETPNVTSCNPQVNLADFDIAFLFRVHDRVVDTSFGRFKINNLPLANAARRDTSDTNDLQRPIVPRLGDHRADFRSANLKAYKDVVSSHSIESSLPGALAALEAPMVSPLRPLPAST